MLGKVLSAFARSQYEGAGGPFTLIGTDGETVSAEDLRGKPFALFFGFTNCPDVCPTTLVEASGWLDALGEDADELRFVFVSVDPERDTPERLGRYVAAFDERIMGLTAASEETIAEVADRYRIVYEKVPLRNGGYTVNHTSDTLLFDADGSFAGFIPYLPPNMRQNETIAATDNQGNPISIERFRCNLAIRSRRTAARPSTCRAPRPDPRSRTRSTHGRSSPPSPA